MNCSFPGRRASRVIDLQNTVYHSSILNSRIWYEFSVKIGTTHNENKHRYLAIMVVVPKRYTKADAYQVLLFQVMVRVCLNCSHT